MLEFPYSVSKDKLNTTCREKANTQNYQTQRLVAEIEMKTCEVRNSRQDIPTQQ